MKTNSLISIFFFLFSSCTSYIKILESDLPIVKATAIKKYKSCDQNNKTQLIHNSIDAVKEFQSILKKYRDLSFDEKSLLWFMYNIRRYPFTVSKSSRVTIISNSQILDFNHFNPERLFPLQDSINYLSKNYKSNRINDLLKILNTNSSKKYKISNSQYQFLEQNEEVLTNDPNFKNVFTRTGSLLIKGETYKVNNLSFNKKKETIAVADHPLFSFNKLNTQNNLNINCTQDISLYTKGIYPNLDTTNTFQHFFGIKEGLNNFSVIVTTKINADKSIKEKQVFYEKTFANAAICSYPSNIKNKNNILISLLEDDPAQYLFHLINYEIYKLSSNNEIHELISFPRYHFKTNPNKLLFENSKAEESQLDSLLKLDFPVFHAPTLGKVHVFNYQKNSIDFISDSRSNHFITCQ